MNKRIVFLGLLLVAVQGCNHKPTCRYQSSRSARSVTVQSRAPRAEETVTYVEQVAPPVYEPEPKPLLSEDVEGFVLEEQGNSFIPPTEDTEENINIVEQDVVDEAWVDKRLDQAQEHGFRPVYFNFDDETLRQDQKSVLDANLRKIAGLVRKGSTVVIEGHACRFAGSALYNMMLSEKRAAAVGQYLIEQGIPRDRLKIVGRGYEMCIVPEGDVEQQAPNRRVEFYVLKDQPAAEQIEEALTPDLA